MPCTDHSSFDYESVLAHTRAPIGVILFMLVLAMSSVIPDCPFLRLVILLFSADVRLVIDNIINKRQLRIAKGNDRHGNQPVVEAKRHYQNRVYAGSGYVFGHSRLPFFAFGHLVVLG
jgi:hypothetical protein